MTSFLLKNIYIRIGTFIHEQVVGIIEHPLLLSIYTAMKETLRDFILSLYIEHLDDINTVFNNTLIYPDDSLSIDNDNFPSLVKKYISL